LGKYCAKFQGKKIKNKIAMRCPKVLCCQKTQFGHLGVKPHGLKELKETYLSVI